MFSKFGTTMASIDTLLAIMESMCKGKTHFCFDVYQIFCFDSFVCFFFFFGKNTDLAVIQCIWLDFGMRLGFLAKAVIRSKVSLENCLIGNIFVIFFKKKNTPRVNVVLK